MGRATKYKTETAALVFCKTAFAGDQHTAMPWRADAHKVAKSILDASQSVIFAHVAYGPNDIIAMAWGDNDAIKRQNCVATIRALDPPDHNIVTETEQLLITSIHGRRGTKRSDWTETMPFCGWMLAKVGVPAPAQDIAEDLSKVEGRDKDKGLIYAFTFAAPLIGSFDIAAFVEAKDKTAFDAALNNVSRRTYYFTDSRILAGANFL